MIYRLDPAVVWFPGDGEVRFYHPVAREFRTLDGTAARIWLLLAEGGGSAAIAEQAAVAAQDVQEFVDLLLAQGLVRIDRQPPGPGPAEVLPGPAPRAAGG
ncbi:PqqD family peptide modification chaperone [Kitasatospora sp. NBC_00374]|uniref:PqqD family peptide modification chaperone n=1 Tax=Kitasatospora sp. NBC_00374 TaxID=2975964 RepID=UPI0030E1FDF7